MAGRYRQGAPRRGGSAPPEPRSWDTPPPVRGDEYLPPGAVPYRSTRRLVLAIVGGLVLLLALSPWLLLLFVRALCYVMCDPA
jgi:hypothetical protein